MAEGDKNFGDKSRDWWWSLQRLRHDGEPNNVADPGGLARLRRAGTPLEAAVEAQTGRLYRLLYGDRMDEKRLARFESVAALAATLAHVRSDLGRGHMAALLGSKGDGDMPVFSDLRMQRLCRAGGAKAMMTSFREAVLILDRCVPVSDLADAMLDWLHPERGSNRRTRWLFDYHGAGNAAPESIDTSEIGDT